MDRARSTSRTIEPGTRARAWLTRVMTRSSWLRSRTPTIELRAARPRSSTTLDTSTEERTTSPRNWAVNTRNHHGFRRPLKGMRGMGNSTMTSSEKARPASATCRE